MVGEEQARGLDLSRWKLAFCGAEPVRAGTLARFAARFAACGFDAKAFFPCYGMAEATLFVTGGRAGEGATVVQDLAGMAGAALSCGFPRLGCEVVLLEPGADRAVAEGAVGEIAVAGPQVSSGFWQPGVGVVADAARIADVDGRRMLRSGDLGRMVDGNLHVVGRLRNMVILRGANIHAEDVEQTVALHRGAEGLGAVAVLPVTEADEEGIVLVCELARGAVPEAVDLPGLAAAVAEAHGILPRESLLVAAGGIRRTLSGKLQREATRAAWREGALAPLARHVPVRGRGAA
jgi:acyl-CoA synthetase (AMP-forming)/AMP-acid ligase II